VPQDEYKKFAKTAARAVRGEAYFEALVSSHCIPHHVYSPKDLGIDYFCEWIHGERPTGILFAAQVKSTTSESASPILIGEDTQLNGLNKYDIHYSLLNVDRATRIYWRTLGIPAYLFVVVESTDGDEAPTLDCYYRRFSPHLTKDEIPEDYDYHSDFYQVNEGASFIAFKRPGWHGFARDLFIDHVRWTYFTGSIAYPNPRDFGLQQFEPNRLFIDMFPEYKERIHKTYELTKRLLEAGQRGVE
jgi:hypothetical protein